LLELFFWHKPVHGEKKSSSTAVMSSPIEIIEEKNHRIQ
jgi:hypothetical protein